MITRLNSKDFLNIIEFFDRIPDKAEDMYITIDKKRILLKNNSYLIKKILKYQEVYGLIEDGLKGIIIIYREKPYRPYLKILAENDKYVKDLIKYLFWNYPKAELFLKLKISNPLLDVFVKRIKITDKFTKYVSKGKFYFKGMRGQEILLTKRIINYIKKVTSKDEGDNNEHSNLKS